MGISKNSKSQITNSKQILRIKNQTQNNSFFGPLAFGVWQLFEI